MFFNSKTINQSNLVWFKKKEENQWVRVWERKKERESLLASGFVVMSFVIVFFNWKKKILKMTLNTLESKTKKKHLIINQNQVAY